MADDFGLSFSPTTTTDPRKAQADPNAPVQEAVRTLSLRLPRVVGARGAAPQPLLNGPGSAGLGPLAAPGAGMAGPGGPSFGIEQLLMTLFGAGAAPAPNVTPGIGGAGFAGQPSTPGFSFNEGAQGIPAAPAPAAPAPRPVPNKPMDESRIQSI